MYSLDLSDLVSNAFIQFPDKKFFSYKDLSKFQDKITEKLIQQHKQVYWDMCRDKTLWTLSVYKDYFTEIEINNELGIELNDNVSIEDLRDNFRSYLSLELLVIVSSIKEL